MSERTRSKEFTAFVAIYALNRLVYWKRMFKLKAREILLKMD
jgi:hypothetical protein